MVLFARLRTRGKTSDLPISLAQNIVRTIEDGLVPARRQRRSSKHTISAASTLLKTLFGSIGLFGIGVVGFYGCVAFKREMVFSELESRIPQIGAVCLAPVHLGDGRSAAHYVAFGQKSKYPRMISPRIMSVTGKEVVSSEKSTLCNDQALPVERFRHEIITVMFKSHPLLTNETAVVVGDQAICLQHMIDIFAGKDPCEIRSHLHRQNKKKKKK